MTFSKLSCRLLLLTEFHYISGLLSSNESELEPYLAVSILDTGNCSCHVLAIDCGCESFGSVLCHAVGFSLLKTLECDVAEILCRAFHVVDGHAVSTVVVSVDVELLAFGLLCFCARFCNAHVVGECLCCECRFRSDVLYAHIFICSVATAVAFLTTESNIGESPEFLINILVILCEFTTFVEVVHAFAVHCKTGSL